MGLGMRGRTGRSVTPKTDRTAVKETAWSFCPCGLRKGPPNPARRLSHGRVESSVTDLPLSGVSTACIPATFDLKGDVGLGSSSGYEVQ
jgi:hypothetical protein